MINYGEKKKVNLMNNSQKNILVFLLKKCNQFRENMKDHQKTGAMISILIN